MSIDKEKDITARLLDKSTRRKAFEDMVNMFSSRLYWQIRRMLTYHDDTDDVLQNTFIKAWNGMESFRGDSKLSTWLYKIAYNETLTFISKQRETISIDGTTDFDDENSTSMLNTLESDTYFDGDETMHLLQAAVSGLPAKQRSVFTMKYFDDMKYEEIADVTGTSVGALKASYHLAVKKIEEFINNHE